MSQMVNTDGAEKKPVTTPSEEYKEIVTDEEIQASEEKAAVSVNNWTELKDNLWASMVFIGGKLKDLGKKAVDKAKELFNQFSGKENPEVETESEPEEQPEKGVTEPEASAGEQPAADAKAEERAAQAAAELGSFDQGVSQVQAGQELSQ